TPISIEWDFLNLKHIDELRGTNVDWKVSIPFDGSFSQYYAQAINTYAPHPAAARLWEEYLASPEGQNLRLKDYARPVLMVPADRTPGSAKALPGRG
ncbi:ABC transporter substrate-binding protein, partial [Streptomyces sp. NPDC006458]